MANSINSRTTFIQKIVPPSQIESELICIWDALAKLNKTRASLFNLIIFNPLSPRTDYIRTIVQKIIDKFPCRIIFISHDTNASKNYLKTAVSILTPEGESTIACDHIDIGVAGSDWERVPSVILPHILPDLPVYLLWTEDPTKPHPLFYPLAEISTRIIFDSESADNLLAFAKTMLFLNVEKKRNVTDLNWARLEGWRNLLAATFESKDRLADLYDIKEMKIVYNARVSESFCHLKIQSMYLLAFFASRLNWKMSHSTQNEGLFHFAFDRDITASIAPTSWDNLGPGAVISLEMTTHKGSHYSFARNSTTPHHLTIQISSTNCCYLPYQFILAKTAIGQSLAREIFLKGTHPFFLEVLHQLLLLDKEKLC